MADARGLFPITVVMTLTGQEPGDEEIQTDVLEELKWDTHMQPNEIGVVVKDGFWESLGYNNHGDPWKEERYWGD